MYIFGHTGITLGAAVLSIGAIETWCHRRTGHPLVSWTLMLSRFMDIRLLLVGSLLPDIIDKPVGYFFFQNGRIFSHSLLFTIVLLSFGIWFYRRWQMRWLLPLGIGSLTHLIFDQMWLSPRTLFWPLFDWLFPRYPQSDWIGFWFNDLTYNRITDIEEIIGAFILISFAALVIYRKKIKAFITKGVL